MNADKDRKRLEKYSKKMSPTEAQIDSLALHRELAGHYKIAIPDEWKMSTNEWAALTGPTNLNDRRAGLIAACSLWITCITLGILVAFVLTGELALLAQMVAIVAGISGAVVTFVLPNLISNQKMYSPEKLTQLDPRDIILLDAFSPATTGTMLYELNEMKHNRSEVVASKIYNITNTLFQVGKEQNLDWSDNMLLAHAPNELQELLTLTYIHGNNRARAAAAQLQSFIAFHKNEPPLSSPGSTRSMERMSKLWDGAITTHDDIIEAWTTIIIDPLSALDHSLLLDVTQPRTEKFLESYRSAEELRAINGIRFPGIAEAEAYISSVNRLKEAWDEAHRHAEQVNTRWLPDREQKIVSKAKGALALANNAGTDDEASQAAQSAARLLREVNSFVLPAQALLAVETQARKTITASKVKST